MRFTPATIAGVFTLDLERREDERGFFARSFCAAEFASAGLAAQFVQCNISWNARRGTLRGLHYQREPQPEAKLVRCTQGAIWDVVVDLRADSPTRHCWQSFELSARNRRAVYVPAGCAHGFQTLADDSEVFYQMAASYRAELQAGVRWDDPALGITWPLPDPILSERDRSYAWLA